MSRAKGIVKINTLRETAQAVLLAQRANAIPPPVKILCDRPDGSHPKSIYLWAYQNRMQSNSSSTTQALPRDDPLFLRPQKLSPAAIPLRSDKARHHQSALGHLGTVFDQQRRMGRLDISALLSASFSFHGTR